jgi:hypothetical protein
MSIKHGSLDKEPRKRRNSNITLPNADIEEATPEALKTRLLQLSKQSRYPAVATTSTKELLERIEPKKTTPEPALSAEDARKIAGIYDRLFSGAGCSHCGAKL